MENENSTVSAIFLFCTKKNFLTFFLQELIAHFMAWKEYAPYSFFPDDSLKKRHMEKLQVSNFFT